ncbi:MAG TPA: glycosyltransferase [Candidatus Coprenecus pullistercoris]|nr:glycosyltransferase [Candidatus Coprenecus pullistercoris]
MKRVLIITYYWPPASGSGVQRWLKMSKYLPQYGWQPVIYTPENPEAGMTDESLLRDISPEVKVIKRPILEPYAVFNALTGNKGKNSEKASAGSGAVNPINAVGHKSPMMRLSLWLRANVFVPDPRFLWIRPSVRFLKKYLREHPVDAIISTGPPHSMHLIARALHRSTGIPWTADFRDPWTRIFYFKHLPLTSRSRKRYAAMELSVLREADHVVAVTDSMVRDFLEELGPQWQDKGKFHVIENGYDEADFTGITAAELPAGFNLVHTGLFSAEGNPRSLWKVLAELSSELPGFGRDLHLTFAGKTDPEILAAVREAGLGDRLTDRGYIPHHEANRLQKAADLLLLPLREEPEATGILTGKYFEYLAAGRPIAAFGPHDSVLERSLGLTQTGHLFDWNEEAPLKEFLKAVYSGTYAFSPEPGAISAYTRRTLAGRFAEIL